MPNTSVELSNEKPLLRWRNILVPTDFSEGSQPAIRMAAYLAERCGAKITLLHVVHFPASAPLEAGLAVDEALSSSHTCLDRLAGNVPIQLVCERLAYLSMEGTVQGIVEAALQVSADLIVMSTRPYGFFRHLLGGSRTEEVLHSAPCAVLVVPPSRNVIPQNSHPARPQAACSQRPGRAMTGTRPSPATPPTCQTDRGPIPSPQ